MDAAPSECSRTSRSIEKRDHMIDLMSVASASHTLPQVEHTLNGSVDMSGRLENRPRLQMEVGFCGTAQYAEGVTNVVVADESLGSARYVRHEVCSWR